MKKILGGYNMDEKLNLLVIGDSIGQGYNSKVGCGTAGSKKSNDSFYQGYSYGDYLIEYIREFLVSKQTGNLNINEIWNSINYNNLSLIGAIIKDYDSLLNLTYNEDFFSLLNINKKLHNMANIKFDESIYWYKDFQKNNLKEAYKNYCIYLQAEIKKATCILFSLGGNEFQGSFPFNSFRKLVLETNVYKQKKIYDSFMEEIDKLLAKTEKEYVDFILKVKKFNPTANMLLVNYIIPFLPFLTSYQNYLSKSNPIIFKDIVYVVLDKFNAFMQRVSSQTNTDFVDVYDKKVWIKNMSTLYENIVDTHPTEKGYREIARKIFLKLISNNYLYFLRPGKWLTKIKYGKEMFLVDETKSNIISTIKKFEFPLHKSNKIINAFRCWNEETKQVNNPYFELITHEFPKLIEKDNEKNNGSKEETNYSNFYSYTFENILYSVKFLPKDSKLFEYIKSLLVNKETMKSFLTSVLNSDHIESIILAIEKIDFKKEKFSWIKIIEKVFKNNEQNLYSLFTEIFTKNPTFVKTIKELFALFITDLKANKPIKLHNWVANDIFYKLSFEIGFKEIFIKLINEFWKHLINLRNYQTFFEFIKSFIIANRGLVQDFVSKILDYLLSYSEKEKDNVSKFILDILKISEHTMTYKEWNRVDKIINLLISNLNDMKFRENFIDILINAFTKIDIWKEVDFTKTTIKKKYAKLIVKLFFKKIIKKPFSKENRKIYKLLFSLWRLKVVNFIKTH
ncbi:SGNH/GDSL hydrolase family protein [Metamycoplasma hyosynoviae]|uniref:SGNH/GDSL hydrolase family protein n=1 Tax=Metamycoplasma hyosynoviae TaxID=29559 RepID=UPI0023620C21|nr:SGNH/GDSL hydrolase family protein [Metamycoplasma hyosynoviae]MDD1372064.1 SGNH/GDSL hydrolase family protein [Metamycoplasma hyosynoviae]